ncbi:MAG: HNH endonuclease signature motif containing protein [Vicingaceae bacterium]
MTPEEDYSQELTCIYKNEKYAVRDNGMVLRHPRENGRKRLIDNKWDFGKVNQKTGYNEMASVRVHRIVATAFHGPQPLDKPIVDHKDTNKQNNRPENLRWVTRLENIILNPITVKRIESACNCTIDEFLADIERYIEILSMLPPDISWMRNVSKAEGKACFENLTNWAKSDKSFSGKPIGNWIFRRGQINSEERIQDVFEKIEKRTGIRRQTLSSNKALIGKYYEARKHASKLLRSELNLSDYEIGELLGLSATTVNSYLEASSDMYSGDYKEVSDRHHRVMSERSNIIPNNVIQLNWTAQSDFPSCPKTTSSNPISEYEAQLNVNEVFFENAYYHTITLKKAIIEEGESLLVMYEVIKRENSDKRWGIMKITYDNQKFIHEIVTNYNGTLEHYWLKDVENHFTCLIDGKQWTPLYDSQGREFKGDYMPL